MAKPKKRAKRHLKVGLLTAVTALVASAFGANVANAANLTVTLDDAYLKLATTFHIIDTNPAPPGTPTPPIVLTSTDWEDTGSNDFSVPAAGFNFPAFTGPTGIGDIEAAVTITPPATTNGNWDPATGTLSTSSADFSAVIALTSVGNPTLDATCTISPIPMAFSSATNTPFVSDPFNIGVTPPAQGAIQTSWSALPAAPQPGCDLINVLTSVEPGGLWLANGVAAPTKPAATPPSGGPPTPTTTTKKKKKKCKKGFKLTKVKKKGKKGKKKCVKKKKKKKKK